MHRLSLCVARRARLVSARPIQDQHARALHLHQRRSPRARLHRCDARRARPRRRPLCAGDLAAVLAAPTIAGFAGRPYAEVAVEVIRPFVGDAIADADLVAHGARGLRHASAIRRSRRSRSSAPSTFVLELFHGPTLAFKDVAMQFLGAADGSRAGRARRAHHHRGRDLRRHRRRRGRGLPRPRAASTSSCSFRTAASPTCSGGMMTTAERRQRPCARDRRHLRRLPGDREGPVQPSRLPRPRAALRRQLDQLGAHRRADRLLLHRRGRARRAAPQGRVHRADRQFRRRLRRLCRASAWACRSTGW